MVEHLTTRILGFNHHMQHSDFVVIERDTLISCRTGLTQEMLAGMTGKKC